MGTDGSKVIGLLDVLLVDEIFYPLSAPLKYEELVTIELIPSGWTATACVRELAGRDNEENLHTK